MQMSLPPAQTDRYCNLIRWFDHMQHTVDTTGVLAKVYFRKPGLPEALPPVLAGPSKASFRTFVIPFRTWLQI